VGGPFAAYSCAWAACLPAWLTTWLGCLLSWSLCGCGSSNAT